MILGCDIIYLKSRISVPSRKKSEGTTQSYLSRFKVKSQVANNYVWANSTVATIMNDMQQ